MRYKIMAPYFLLFAFFYIKIFTFSILSEGILAFKPHVLQKLKKPPKNLKRFYRSTKSPVKN